ncbi:Endonuclease-reverse transcriptase [Popillia japonica]|uniref:Endonuclease-reverse transcriptase n=1 Tax=Popillia japonica TaxID=7064 RepID=A0AAW1L6J6_POPJA
MACEMDIDMAIISEPNINISLSHNYIMDKNRNVAIYIRNKNMGIQGCSVGEGFVCIKWKDWCIYGCYCSPNIPYEDFKSFIDALTSNIKATGLDAVIAGDFNSKSPMWGSQFTDISFVCIKWKDWCIYGCYCSPNIPYEDFKSFIDALTRDTPTFQRGKTKSYIDITWAMEKISERVQKWRVLQGEFFTFHNHIYFEISYKSESRVKTNRIRRFLDKSRFVEQIKECFLNKEETITPDQFIDKLFKLNKECTISVHEDHRSMPYWWNGEIECKRKECHRLRRRLIRENGRRNGAPARATMELAYKKVKQELKYMIIETKRNHWKRLLEDLDEHIWGDGFKLVMRHLKKLTPPYNPSMTRRLEIVKELFIVKEEEEFVFSRRSSIARTPPPTPSRETSQQETEAAMCDIGKSSVETLWQEDDLTSPTYKLVGEVSLDTSFRARANSLPGENARSFQPKTLDLMQERKKDTEEERRKPVKRLREEDEGDQLQELRKQFDRLAKTVNELVAMTDASTKTKTEIKNSIKKLKRQTTDVYREWKALDEGEGAYKRKTETKEMRSISIQVDPADIKNEMDEKKLKIANKIREVMEGDGTYNKLTEVLDEKWPLEIYKITETESATQSNKLLENLKLKYAGLTELIEKNEGQADFLIQTLENLKLKYAGLTELIEKNEGQADFLIQTLNTRTSTNVYKEKSSAIHLLPLDIDVAGVTSIHTCLRL